MVSGVEVDGTEITTSTPATTPSTPLLVAVQTAPSELHSRDRTDFVEEVLWAGSPSQWTNAHLFILSGLLFWLVIPPAIAIVRWFQTRSMSATLTNERIRFEWGVLSRSSEEIELFRIRDTSVSQTMLDRWRGIGSVSIMSTDRSARTLVLRGIVNPSRVREMIRAQSLQSRRDHGVRTVEND
jgi:uncharacterized membrane protein YdbT with pleckstrin-like domain